MKITDRIMLLKAGYSREDIAEMIKEENAEPVENKPEDEAPSQDYSDIISALANEVKTLKEAVQASNIQNTDIKGPAHSTDQALDILGSLIDPNYKKGEN